MDATNLSDYQLYQLVQNKKLDATIRKTAIDEFTKRNLNPEQVELLEASYILQFPDQTNENLKTSSKLLLVVLPFFTEIHSLIAGRMLAKRQPRKWKDYWKYICLGFLLWTIAVILFAKYDLFI